MLNQLHKGLLNVEHDRITGAVARIQWDAGWGPPDFTDIETICQSFCWIDGQDHNPQTLVRKLER